MFFQGKRLDNGEWIEGQLFKSETNNRAYIAIVSNFYKPILDCEEYFDGAPKVIDMPTFFFEVDPDTIGQYIGRKDKNGKMVFEKDVFKDNNGYKYIVKWNDSECCFVLKNITGLKTDGTESLVLKADNGVVGFLVDKDGVNIWSPCYSVEQVGNEELTLVSE